MKKLLTILSIFLALLIGITKTDARVFENPIRTAIHKSDMSRKAMIAVSFKEIGSNEAQYELHSKKPMTPASVQKLITMLPSIDTLGKDYEFKTQLYQDKNKNLYLKLGADPYLTRKELKNMIRELNRCKITAPANFYIDDTIVDKKEWGEGWQWDDDLNELIPKFGAYNLDSNLLTINFAPSTNGAPAKITPEVFYPTSIINTVITGGRNNIKLERTNYISPDVINASGTITYNEDFKIPINYPRRYFILRLEEILRGQKIGYYGDFQSKKVPADATLISEVKHPFDSVLKETLTRSNNMMAETTFKVAGGKYKDETGTVDDSIEMLDEYYKSLGLDIENIRIVDGSGVSKNNVLTADFVTDVLLKIAKSDEYEYLTSHMAQPGEGTLTNRMLYFKGKLHAKTGTLSNISTLAGYLTAKSGKTYAFCIFTNDANSKSADKKAFEEYVLRNAYDEL